MTGTLAGLLVAAAAGRLVLARWRFERLHRGARWVQVSPPPVVEPGAAEALWSNLAGLLGRRRFRPVRPHVAFELAWSVDGLQLGLWVPGLVAPRVVERALEAAWPGARAQARQAGSPLPASGRVLAGELRLDRWLAGVRTDHGVDPLRALLGAAGELAAGEQALVQLICRPASTRRRARALAHARTLLAGRHPASTPRPARLAFGIADLLTPGAGRHRTTAGADPLRAADGRLLLGRLAGPAWEVTIRYAVATAAAEPVEGRLRARASALAAAFGVYAGRGRLIRRRLPSPVAARLLAARQPGAGDLLGTGELAALAHLPIDLAVPGLARAVARPIAPTPGTPTTGKILGDAETGPRRPVALQPGDGRYHMHLLGATGSGKSTLVTNLALEDIRCGRGVVVIDPKGDLITDLLDRIPADAVPRVVLLDPDEHAAPPTMNVLEGPDPDLAVDHLVGILRRIWLAHWGPRIDDVLRASCLTLLRRPGATLADVPKLLSDPVFRRPYLAGLHDPVGLGGFWDWYESQSPAAQAQIVGPIMTRLRAFLLRSFVRAVVGSATSSFDMGAILDGGICLVRVPKGQLGDETSRLLGSFVVARVWQAATARAARGQPHRADATLYVDEAHNFLTLPYQMDELLAEARGYGLGLVIAHQHLAQLPRELALACSANARTKVFFACSPEDARDLERHVIPELRAHDLTHLGAYQAAVRLVCDGRELAPCTVRTRPAPSPIPGRAAQVRTAAAARYGRTAGQRRTERLERELAGPDPRLRLPLPLGAAAPSPTPPADKRGRR